MGCYNTKIIDAPIAKVWAAIRDFHDLSWAKGVVETCENVGDVPGTQLGARRSLKGAFTETLVALDDQTRVIKYSIDAGPGPLEKVQGYVGCIRLLEHTDGDQTFVEWSSTWSDSNGGVKEFCDPVYKGALEALAANVKR